ncbi:hypothetical protein SDJN03_22739, partial [Cucurbita argyrosperma subsp. sororia]
MRPPGSRPLHQEVTNDRSVDWPRTRFLPSFFAHGGESSGQAMVAVTAGEVTDCTCQKVGRLPSGSRASARILPRGNIKVSHK